MNTLLLVGIGLVLGLCVGVPLGWYFGYNGRDRKWR
jgi:ABC-type dipeptide/oligopeptide/nickel transport system permease component